jgi:hypothetical protein
MTRILRFALLTLTICTLCIPAFALCRTCNDQGICEHLPESFTTCRQFIDFCQEDGNCALLTEVDPLADQLTVASVEVTSPNGVTKTDAAPRVAELKPHVQLAPVPSTR